LSTEGYFHRVQRQTGTRLWINNPTGEEIDKALEAGAISCTTNPAYCSRLLSAEPGYVEGLIDEVIREIPDCESAARAVYQRASRRILQGFLPSYERSGGTAGFVTLQGDPRKEDDARDMVAFALENRALGANFMAKIPVTRTGLDAMEKCIALNIPICATEVFSLSQAVCAGEMYRRVSARTGNHPPLYLTHISGIFDDYLRKTAARDGIAIRAETISQAGCAVARREYRMLKERGFEVTMLGGGARSLEHFTELVGGDVHITINWSTAVELIQRDGPVNSRIDVETPREVLDELSAAFPVFGQAWREDALSVDEFADYGPVRLFRNMFLEGWYMLLAAVARRLHTQAR
jgi:transaldolase